MHKYNTLPTHKRTLFTEKADIVEFLEFFKIKNYNIMPDMTVNIERDVLLKRPYLEELNIAYLPINFGTINGNFIASIGLHSLEGSPHTVMGTFDVSDNFLTSLEHGPTNVRDSYSCVGNRLTNLIGAPEHIKKNFFCSENLLTTLEGGPEVVGIEYLCDHNLLENLKGMPLFEEAANFSCQSNPTLVSLEGFHSGTSAMRRSLFYFYDTQVAELARFYNMPQDPNHPTEHTIIGFSMVEEEKKKWDDIQAEKKLLGSIIPSVENKSAKLLKI